MDDLKSMVDGEDLMGRIKYRKDIAMAKTKKSIMNKGQIFRKEHAHAKHMDAADKNADFGFSCLHYSVSEAVGTLKIEILNKSNNACTVKVQTVDGEAKAGEDYDAVNETIQFEKGQASKTIDVKIIDDEGWEPDEDFFVQLKHHETGENLTGKDTQTRVTIIDDDKPGQICFRESKTIKALAPTSDKDQSMA